MRATVANTSSALMALVAVFLSPTLAAAHISVASGPGYAGTTQEITFQVGHGCAGSDGKLNDTVSVTIDIPDSVLSLRAVPSPFGKVTVQKTGAVVKSVTWQKKTEDVLLSDDDFYKFTIRVPVPNTPFSTIYFVAHQTCNSSAGPITVDWSGTAATASEDAGAAEPAPALIVLPAHRPGWNKLTVPVAVVADLFSKVFADAQIVWKGTAAFSSNPVTQTQIEGTAGVTALGDLGAGDEIWVKY
ncbi:MAG: hypothetical protein JWN04_2245 [Myxococcaceae bacterium]|nr:hypothetical protein [Myxococcaceae bacterium]